jgi:hypothetical protein
MPYTYPVERYGSKFPHIDPVTKTYRDLPGRFWANVDATGDCWQWIGPATGSGYGDFRLKPEPGPGSRVRSHRYAWEYLVGPIPESLTLDHLCRNRRCVNPDHLEPTTRGVNVLRGFSPPVRVHRSNRTTCKHGHPWDAKNTAWDVKGHRYCRRCSADSMARRRKMKGGR